MMEYWNTGRMEKDLGKNRIMEEWKNGEKMGYSKPTLHHSNIPIFPHSIIPLFHYSLLKRGRFHGLGDRELRSLEEWPFGPPLFGFSFPYFLPI